MSSTRVDITQILIAHGRGDSGAFDTLVPLVYEELRVIARAQLRRGRPGDVLNTTGLVHESYLKLVDQTRAQWHDRNHFFGVAASAMRQVIVDAARSHNRQKRGGGIPNLPLEENRAPLAVDDEGIVALNEALEQLAQVDQRLTKIVECRFFAGYTEDETAEILDVSSRTVQREWRRARAWLREFIESPE